MELILDRNGLGNLFMDLFCDGENSGLRLRDGRLGATTDNVGDVAIVGRLIDIDLGISGVLDFVNRRSTPAKDARNATSRDGELYDVVGLFLELESLSTPTSERVQKENWMWLTSRSSAFALATPFLPPLI